MFVPFGTSSEIHICVLNDHRRLSSGPGWMGRFFFWPTESPYIEHAPTLFAHFSPQSFRQRLILSLLLETPKKDSWQPLHHRPGFLHRPGLWLIRLSVFQHPCLCAGIVTRRPLVLQLHKVEGAEEYAEFLHKPNVRYKDWSTSSHRTLKPLRRIAIGVCRGDQSEDER